MQAWRILLGFKNVFDFFDPWLDSFWKSTLINRHASLKRQGNIRKTCIGRWFPSLCEHWGLFLLNLGGLPHLSVTQASGTTTACSVSPTRRFFNFVYVICCLKISLATPFVINKNHDRDDRRHDNFSSSNLDEKECKLLSLMINPNLACIVQNTVSVRMPKVRPLFLSAYL